jgi:hypothetical protein
MYQNACFTILRSYYICSYHYINQKGDELLKCFVERVLAIISWSENAILQMNFRTIKLRDNGYELHKRKKTKKMSIKNIVSIFWFSLIPDRLEIALLDTSV